MDTQLPTGLPQNAIKAFQGKIFTVWQWEQKLFNGNTSTFETLTRPDTAYMLPVLEDHSLLLIQDEQPHRGAVLTVPRGRVEAHENPLAAAKRELLEETGYAPQDIEVWDVFRPWGKVSWTVHYFIGRGAHKVAEPILDGGERIALQPTTLQDFIRLAAEGELHDQRIQTMMLQAQLDPKKMETFKHLLYG